MQPKNLAFKLQLLTLRRLHVALFILRCLANCFLVFVRICVKINTPQNLNSKRLCWCKFICVALFIQPVRKQMLLYNSLLGFGRDSNAIRLLIRQNEKTETINMFYHFYLPKIRFCGPAPVLNFTFVSET